MLKHNPNILALLQTGPFCVERHFGMEIWANYLEELVILQAGASYADLKIGQKRADSLPGIIVQSESGSYKIIQGTEQLRDVENTPAGSYAHLRLNGFMRSQDGASSRGINSLVDDINAANNNENIVGILLEVNSGGGQSIAGQIANTAIASSAKPVVVLGHFVASGAYMASVAAKKVIASSPAARFGSIGTMMTLPRGFAERYNRHYQDMYATKSKNKNRSFRQYLQGDVTGFLEGLEETNEQFLDLVKSSRTLKGSNTMQEHTLSGEMFSANAAMRRGLVDAIGGFDLAISELKKAVKAAKD